MTAALPPQRERAFQACVEGLLRDILGYWVFSIPDSRRATARGLPDVLAIDPRRPDVLLAWEFKAQGGRVRPEQAAVLAMLAHVRRIDARIVRPADWPSVKEELTR